jgi:predicted transcriptional regulator
MTKGAPTKTDNQQFRGFDIPRQNWFKLPNNWTDLTATMQSWAEQKVVEYVLRHTWGYQEYGGLKRITLDEFEKGRKSANGTRIDAGIGMRRQAIISGIRQAIESGFLIEDVNDSDKGRVKKYYGLRMMEHLSGQGYDYHTPEVRPSYTGGMKNTRRSEKETIERNSKKEKTVNGDIKKLKDLEQPEEKTEYIAQQILDQLGDTHSLAFYRLVAAKVPEDVIYKALAEIKADGAKSPAKVFTHRMKLYALKHLKRGIGLRRNAH